MLNICIGIVSYLPENNSDRAQRINGLNNLLQQLNNFWPNLPIIIISQNWKDFKPVEIKNKIIRFDYAPLGILKARQTLREKFLETTYDGIILFDDDCHIVNKGKAYQTYLKEIKKHIDGFAFCLYREDYGESAYYNPYAPSQLNLCYISKKLFEKANFIVDPQKQEGYEDRILSSYLHYIYPELEFNIPAGLYHDHFKNVKIQNPSTWANGFHPWEYMNIRTFRIERYLCNFKRFPPDLKTFYPYKAYLRDKALKNKNV